MILYTLRFNWKALIVLWYFLAFTGISVAQTTYPVIFATDYTFPEVHIGDSVIRAVRIYNKGSADLIVSDCIIVDRVNFLVDRSSLPHTIKPNEWAVFTVGYAPSSENRDSIAIVWKSNTPDTKVGISKSFSILKGLGTRPGVIWDRAIETDTVLFNQSKIIRVALLCLGSASSALIDSIVFEGVNASEYRIYQNQLGYDSLINFRVNKGDMVWLDVLFTPDSILRPDESSEHWASLTVYGEKGIKRSIDFRTFVIPSLSYQSSSFKKINSIDLYPNPCLHQIRVRFDCNLPQKVIVKLTDALGRAVANFQLHSHKGMNDHLLDLSEFQSGTYLLSLCLNDKVISKPILVLKQ